MTKGVFEHSAAVLQNTSYRMPDCAIWETCSYTAPSSIREHIDTSRL